MNEREEFLTKFNKAMPLIEALDKNENEAFKFSKTKDRLAKIIVIVVGMLIIGGIPTVCVESLGYFIQGSFPFVVFLAIMIWLYTVNKKKIKKMRKK